jgi:hypothetical protein
MLYFALIDNLKQITQVPVKAEEIFKRKTIIYLAVEILEIRSCIHGPVLRQ